MSLTLTGAGGSAGGGLPPGPTSLSVTSDPATNPTTALTNTWVPAANPSGLTTTAQEIDQSITGGTSWVTVDHALASGATSKIVGSLTNTDTHRFRIRSVFSDASFSAYSYVTAFNTPLTFSGVPTAVDAVLLSFTSDQMADKYLITDPLGNTLATPVISATTQAVSGLDPDTNYGFEIFQQDFTTGHTSLGLGTSVKTFADPPTGVSAAGASPTEIDLTFDALAHDGEIYRSVNGAAYAFFSAISATATSYSDTGLSPGTYGYKVRYVVPHLSDFTAPASAAVYSVPRSFTAPNNGTNDVLALTAPSTPASPPPGFYSYSVNSDLSSPIATVSSTAANVSNPWTADTVPGITQETYYVGVTNSDASVLLSPIAGPASNGVLLAPANLFIDKITGAATWDTVGGATSYGLHCPLTGFSYANSNNFCTVSSPADNQIYYVWAVASALKGQQASFDTDGFVPPADTVSAPIVSLMRAAGKLWQDAGKTVPAVANGDPVYAMEDTFSSHVWTTGGNSNRPILTDLGGGKWALAFDGVDDYLGSDSLTCGDNCSLYFQALPTTLLFDGLFSTSLSSSDQLYFSNSGFQWWPFEPIVGLTGTSASVWNTLSFLCIYTPGVSRNIDYRINGAAASSNAGSAIYGGANWTSPAPYVGVSHNGEVFYAGQFAGMFLMNTTNDTTEASAIEAYLASFT